MPDTVIHAASWLINPDVTPISGGAILVRDGAVAATGTLRELKRKYSAPVFEYPGCAILPGFVNAHTHLELTHFPSWRISTSLDYAPRSFVEWIIQVVKIKRSLQPDDFKASLREGIRASLSAGTTSVGEIVNIPAHRDIYQASGFAGTLYFELAGHEPSRFDHMLEKALSACSATAPPLQGALSPHAAYTLGERSLQQIRTAAGSRHIPLAIHLSESREEAEFVFGTTGPLADILYPFAEWEQYLTPPRRCSPSELFDRSGLITPATLVIHCVHLSPADASILKKRGATVCLCPRSNDCLDVGRAPVALFRKLGIPLVLGTDSLASNDSLSLWDEMRFALDAFPEELSPGELFRMVTASGAAALGLSGRIGSLDPGKRADFQTVSLRGKECGSDIETIIGEGITEEVFTEGRRYAGEV